MAWLQRLFTELLKLILTIAMGTSPVARAVATPAAAMYARRRREPSLRPGAARRCSMPAARFDLRGLVRTVIGHRRRRRRRHRRTRHRDHRGRQRRGHWPAAGGDTAAGGFTAANAVVHPFDTGAFGEPQSLLECDYMDADELINGDVYDWLDEQTDRFDGDTGEDSRCARHSNSTSLTPMMRIVGEMVM